MKDNVFIPFRFNKDGKCIISHYLVWRKPLIRSRYNTPENLYCKVDLNETYSGYLFNHKGEKLYWSDAIQKSQFGDYLKLCDVEGVPLFSHLSLEYCQKHYPSITDFKPLTMGIVLQHVKRIISETPNLNWITYTSKKRLATTNITNNPKSK